MTLDKPLKLPAHLFLSLGLALATGLASCGSSPPKRDTYEEALAERFRAEAAQAESQRAERIQPEDSQGEESTAEANKAQVQTDKVATESSSKIDSSGDKKKELELKLEKAVRGLYLAELELKLADEKSGHGDLKAQDEHQAAERELDTAEKALAHYRKVEAPEILGKQKLKVDRLAFRHQEASQNLEQMRQEYAKFETDSVAKRTGEIVIWRAETSLEFAERELEFGKAAERVLRRTTLPLKIAALEATLTSKQNTVRRTKEAIQRRAFENKLSLTKARDNVTFKQMELENLKAKKDQR